MNYIQTAQQKEIDFNVEPIFVTYHDLADKSRTKSCPNLSDIAIQYELLINYKKDHAPFADPIFELNLRPNMPMAELENVLKTYRLFYRDNLGRYQFHPLVEVW